MPNPQFPDLTEFKNVYEALFGCKNGQLLIRVGSNPICSITTVSGFELSNPHYSFSTDFKRRFRVIDYFPINNPFPQANGHNPLATLSLFLWKIFWHPTFSSSSVQTIKAIMSRLLAGIISNPFIFHWWEESFIRAASFQKPLICGTDVRECFRIIITSLKSRVNKFSKHIQQHSTFSVSLALYWGN